MPGRKTDVKDSEWIADLTRRGLIASSFVPPKPIRDLRDVLRYRRKLVESRSAERNRLLKLLETANIKMASVITDVFGVSGMLTLEALVEGRLDPGQIARLAKGRLRSKIDALRPAVEGFVDEHHRFVLRIQLDRLTQLDEHIEKLDGRIESRLTPFEEKLALLRQIPGVDRIVAATVVAEIGTDMTVFRSAGHLASWAGVCPGNYDPTLTPLGIVEVPTVREFA